MYRARDSKLKREVAIKVLPDTFARDAERVSRFQREAEILASLNHSHIAAIYDLADFGDSRFLVLELVEGETLAERIARGGIPVEEALQIAKQIAEALEAAHEKGITHRDLKPANIKLTRDGSVKVLDFGLAKVREAEGVNANLSNSPTLMTGSMPGMILGTAAYMSPEQAKGRAADRTGDVWAFGCVLYEMLTGRAVFEGETVGEILAGVLKAEPDWRRLPHDTPEGIRRLLRRCLQKNQKLRFRDSGDVRIEIEDAQSGTPTDGDAAQRASRRQERLAWISAVALVTLVAAVTIVWARRPTPSAPEMRFDIVAPPTTDPASLAISPDGQKIVSVAVFDGRSQLWLRSLDSGSARPLTGTDGARFPFWSPDGRSMGFFANSKLKRIDIDSGSVQTLADAPSGRGGAWNRDGTILFAPIANGPIFRISPTGGERTAVTRLEGQQGGHRFPQFLPDGRSFLYHVVGNRDARGIYIGHLDRSETRRLIETNEAAVYASSGQLLFVRQGTLFAQNLDPAALELSGNPFPAAEQVVVDVPNLAAVSTSAAGSIVYRTGLGTLRQFAWFDRSGKEIGKVWDPFSTPGLGSSLSPDGGRLALERTVNGNTDIWLVEVSTGRAQRFTSDDATDLQPTWSPDGNRIVFDSNRKGPYDLYMKPVTGAGSEEPLVPGTTQSEVPNDWSADGGFVLYRSLDAKTSYDLWALPLDAGRKPFPVAQTDFAERDGQFSPDGKWIAFQSDESGGFEIYVQPFPPSGGKSLISTNGGTQVRWRPDGKELFYIALDGRLMAVPIRLPSQGQAVEAGVPVPLFATRVGGAVQGSARQQYMVSPDGQRFLMNTITEEATSPMTVILNWKAKP